MNGVVMKRKMLIRNISYMKRELSEMEKELAMIDAKTEIVEPPPPTGLLSVNPVK